MDTYKLKVSFDTPEHGWIGLSVSHGSTQIYVDVASHGHCFRQLTTALLGLMDERRTFLVAWLEEPEETEWEFSAECGRVTFLLHRSSEAEPLLQLSGKYQEICFPFWRALQSLKGRFPKEELEARIQCEFPFDELERLTASIERMKQRSD